MLGPSIQIILSRVAVCDAAHANISRAISLTQYLRAPVLHQNLHSFYASHVGAEYPNYFYSHLPQGSRMVCEPGA